MKTVLSFATFLALALIGKAVPETPPENALLSVRAHCHVHQSSEYLNFMQDFCCPETITIKGAKIPHFTQIDSPDAQLEHVPHIQCFYDYYEKPNVPFGCVYVSILAYKLLLIFCHLAYILDILYRIMESNLLARRSARRMLPLGHLTNIAPHPTINVWVFLALVSAVIALQWNKAPASIV